jgi:hypothetical protein
MRLQRYRLYQRHGTFYVEDVETRKQESLRTKNTPEALGPTQAVNKPLWLKRRNEGKSIYCHM